MKPIVFEHAIDVAHRPAQVFAILENFDLAPKWMDRCLRLEKISKGGNAPGTKLRLTRRDGAGKKAMDAVLTEYVSNERISLRCSDATRVLVLSFHLHGSRQGTRVSHSVELTPKTLMGRLMAPLTLGRVRRRTRRALRRLHELLDSRDR